MKLSFLVFIMLISLPVFAAENQIRYTSAEFKQLPEVLAVKVTSVFEEEGLAPLADPAHGIPSLGLNQVFVKNEHKFVTLKFGVVGEFETNKILQDGTDYIVHHRNNGSAAVLLFRGFSHEEVIRINKVIFERVAKTDFKLPSLLIADAHAVECAINTASKQNNSAVSSSINAQLLLACLKGVGEGAWASTGGMVAGAAEGLWSFAKSPIESSKKAADTIGKFLSSAMKFTATLLTNPDAAFDQLGSGLGSAWMKIKSTVKQMSAPMKINFVCSLVSSLGVDAAIAFFTAGAATPKLMLTLERIAATLGRATKIINVLSKLNSKALSVVNFTGKKLELFMKKLMKGKLPDTDLIEIESMVKNSQDLGLKALSCYL